MNNQPQYDLVTYSNSLGSKQYNNLLNQIKRAKQDLNFQPLEEGYSACDNLCFLRITKYPNYIELRLAQKDRLSIKTLSTFNQIFHSGSMNFKTVKLDELLTEENFAKIKHALPATHN